MSATFKNAKKRLNQTELRRLMNSHKQDLKPVLKKIESPLAKYNENSQLTCILCKSIVRSENVWPVHINSKAHRENIEVAKKLKERTNNFTTTLKRPITPPIISEAPSKKIKGILKTSQKSELPTDFFDSGKTNVIKSGGTSSTSETVNVERSSEDTPEVIVESAVNSEVLPEGFFDDPKLDAKARNQEYKDPVEEEWEKFMKEIKEADSKSAAIIAEDQEESTVERQIDEIDEQLQNLTRVLDLEKKRETVLTVKHEKMESDDENNSDLDDFNEFDWRSKKAY